jgi:hypothetical protein
MAIEKWGYPTTLVLDGVAGLLCIALLPLMAVKKRAAEAAPGGAIPDAVQP